MKSGINPESCAILATTGPQVAEITAALSNGSRPVAHRVVFDEAQALLASRFAAFLLEPKRPEWIEFYVIEGLELLGNLERAAGTVGGRKAAEDYRRWAEEYKSGKKLPKKGLATAMRSVMMALQKTGYCGDPWVDWLRVKDVVRNSDDRRLAKIASHLDYLVAFGRGRFLASNLLGCWMQTATYAGARAAFDSALAQDLILETSQNLGGIHVMTIHRAKGKQFDGVIVVRKSVPIGQRQWRSSFVWRDDMYPYPRSRKILRVGITPSKKACSDLRPGIPSVPAFAGTLLVNCWPLLLCGMFGRRQPDRRKPARRYRSVAGRGPINVRFFHRGTNRLRTSNCLSAADQRRGKTSPTGGRRCPHGSSSSFIVHPPGRGT